MTEHTILAAFSVEADTYAEAEEYLAERLPRPEDNVHLVCWWVAEDRRDDGSDNDSAVFVDVGEQRRAHDLLRLANLTRSWNVQGKAEDGLTDDDLLRLAYRLLGEYTRRAQRPSIPLVEVANHLESGGMSEGAAIQAAIDHPELLGNLPADNGWERERADVLADAARLGLVATCAECERTDDCECAPGINPLI